MVVDSYPEMDTLIVLDDFNATIGIYDDGYQLYIGLHDSGSKDESLRLMVAGSWLHRPERKN